MDGAKGIRPKGTDGQDYQYRQRVADRYKIRSQAKAVIQALQIVQVIYAVVTLFAFVYGQTVKPDQVSCPIYYVIFAFICSAFGERTASEGTMYYKLQALAAVAAVAVALFAPSVIMTGVHLVGAGIAAVQAYQGQKIAAAA